MRMSEFCENGSEAYLYWLHDSSEKDISSQGYVGVTINPKERFSQHKANIKNKVDGIYNDCRVFDYNDILFDIVDCGESSEIYKKEFLLRPRPFIGWNKGCGGEVQNINPDYCIDILGENITLSVLCNIFGLEPTAVYKRLTTYNKTLDEALELTQDNTFSDEFDIVSINGVHNKFKKSSLGGMSLPEAYRLFCERYDSGDTVEKISRTYNVGRYVVVSILKSVYGDTIEKQPSEFVFQDTWVDYKLAKLTPDDKTYICDALINRRVDYGIISTVFDIDVKALKRFIKAVEKTLNGSRVVGARFKDKVSVNFFGEILLLNESCFNEDLEFLFGLLKSGKIEECKYYLKKTNRSYDSFRKYLRYCGLNKRLQHKRG